MAQLATVHEIEVLGQPKAGLTTCTCEEHTSLVIYALRAAAKRLKIKPKLLRVCKKFLPCQLYLPLWMQDIKAALTLDRSVIEDPRSASRYAHGFCSLDDKLRCFHVAAASDIARIGSELICSSIKAYVCQYSEPYHNYGLKAVRRN